MRSRRASLSWTNGSVLVTFQDGTTLSYQLPVNGVLLNSTPAAVLPSNEISGIQLTVRAAGQRAACPAALSRVCRAARLWCDHTPSGYHCRSGDYRSGSHHRGGPCHRGHRAADRCRDDRKLGPRCFGRQGPGQERA